MHFRMHKAEGVLFRDVLVRAAAKAPGDPARRRRKSPWRAADGALGAPPAALTTIATLRRPVGPPWGKDQKDAALAAVVALRGIRLDKTQGGEGRG